MSDAMFAIVMLLIGVPLIYFALRHHFRALKDNLGIIKEEIDKKRGVAAPEDPLASEVSEDRLSGIRERAAGSEAAAIQARQRAPQPPAAPSRPSEEPDFRPRNADGSVMDSVPQPPVEDNPEHPSYAYHEAIDRKLSQPGVGIADLEVPERNFYLAYGFDSYVMNDGLETWLYEYPKPEQWQQTLDALYIVRADEYHEVFKRFLEVDGKAYAKAAANGEEFEFSEDWDQQLYDVRPGTDYNDKMLYMERRLDAYVAE